MFFENNKNNNKKKKKTTNFFFLQLEKSAMIKLTIERNALKSPEFDFEIIQGFFSLLKKKKRRKEKNCLS